MPTRLYALQGQVPTAELDHTFGWADFIALAPGDSIASYSVAAETGLTLYSDSRSGTDITVWLKGGTAGRTYRVTCAITTTLGRKDTMTAEIAVLEPT